MGDPEATLVFPSDAERFLVTNDIPGFAFKAIFFQYQDYVVSGEPMRAANAAIYGFYGKLACPLQIEGTLAVYGGSGFVGLELAGAISGSGDLFFGTGTITMTGATSNTYSGVTVVSTARLQLKKSGGAIAIPGEVRAERAGYPSRMVIQAPEQIADTATVRWPTDSGDIFFEADETIGTLEVGTVSVYFVNNHVPTLTVSNLVLTGQANFGTNLRLEQSILEVPENAAIYSNGSGQVIVPAGGITLRGHGSVQWGGVYTSPTRIEGVEAGLFVANSDVTMTSGSFTGNARSIVATGGALRGWSSFASSVRLAAPARLETNGSPLRLNGALELGGASLVTLLSSSDRSSRVILENASAEPVIGTFAGIDEGGTAGNRFSVSYHGGDGNDVTVTDLQKPFAAASLTQITQPGFVDEPVTVEVTISGSAGVPTGSVTFSRGWPGDALATVLLIAGKATYSATFDSLQNPALYVDYSGDATYSGSDQGGFGVGVTYRTPTLTSIDPPSGEAGEIVPVTLRGSNFHPRARINGITADNIVFVSSTELRATFDLSSFGTNVSLGISVGAPEGNVYSIPLKFIVALEDEPPSFLSFDQQGAIATVTPAAKTAWMTTRETQQFAQFATDDDGNGIVRWDWGSSIPPVAVWSVVDLASGDFAVRGSGGARAKILPYPTYTFVRDAQGNASRFVLRIDGLPRRTWRMMWVRPGVGAWIQSLTDGSDDDKLANELLVGSIGPMAALGSPPHPAGFAPGDIVIFLPRGSISSTSTSTSTSVFAARLGAELDAQAPGVLQAALRNWRFHENDGVAKLPVLRTNGAAGTVSVRYSTVERSARSGVHFATTTGTLTFAPGETMRWIEIPLINDNIYRGYGVFNVALSEPTGAILGEETAFVVSVSEDDPAPAISLDGPAERHIVETDGPQSVTLALTLTGATTVPVTVEWQTSDLPEKSGEVTFAAGETHKNVIIRIPGNQQNGGTKNILIDFGSGWPVEPRFVRIIVRDDEAANIVASDVTVNEDAGSAQVTLSMTPPQSEPVLVVYSTSDATAVAPMDYTPANGTVSFAPGQTQATINIPIVNDALVEGDESLDLTLEYDSGNLDYEHFAVNAIIVDDEVTTRPNVSIDDTQIAEPEDGMASLTFAVHLSAASSRTVTVHYSTVNGTAVSGLDYQSSEESVVFAPGETQKTIALPVFGDVLAESDETFVVKLGSALNATILDDSGTATIIDNDDARRRAVRK